MNDEMDDFFKIEELWAKNYKQDGYRATSAQVNYIYNLVDTANLRCPDKKLRELISNLGKKQASRIIIRLQYMIDEHNKALANRIKMSQKNIF